jgi:hypothetical protein
MGRIDVEISEAPPAGQAGREVAAHGKNFQVRVINSSKFEQPRL